MLNFISVIILSYLFGSIPWSLVIGKVFFHKDIRTEGSGNLGGTNAGRVLGKKVGITVIVLDALKAFFSMLLASYIAKDAMIYAGLACCIGHCFPIFAQFKGGKAVATFAGMILAYQPLLLLYGLIIFLVLLAITRMVSLTAMVTISLGVLLSLLFNDWVLTAFTLAIDIFIIYRHRANIQRILNGTENKVPMPWDKINKDTK